MSVSSRFFVTKTQDIEGKVGIFPWKNGRLAHTLLKRGDDFIMRSNQKRVRFICECMMVPWKSPETFSEVTRITN